MKTFAKLAAAAAVLSMLICLCACGESDALKGTWTGTDPDYGNVSWSFDGGGGCKMTNDLVGETTGTYVIEGENVSVKLELWDSPVIYAFAIDGNSLSLTDTAGMAANYKLTRQ